MSRYHCLKVQRYTHAGCSIVPLRYEDRFLIMKWRNEQIYHLRQRRPLTEDDQQRYFDHVVSRLYDDPQPEQILLSFLQGDTCIGYGGLVHISWTDRHAEISFIMDTSLEKTHFAEYWSHYLTMLKQMAFDDLELHKIYTYAFDLRPHLYAVLEENGFLREATLREHCCFQGTYKDVVIHAMTVPRYEVVNYVDCSKEQLEEILDLRNRDDVRRWMTNPEVISEDSHFRFVAGLKGNDDRLYFAVYRDGLLVGTYNLTRERGGVWERGIFANPSVMGRGDTQRWERRILATLPGRGIKTLSAKVKRDNQRSVRYHEKLGYQETARDEEYIYYILQLQ